MKIVILSCACKAVPDIQNRNVYYIYLLVYSLLIINTGNIFSCAKTICGITDLGHAVNLQII